MSAVSHKYNCLWGYYYVPSAPIFLETAELFLYKSFYIFYICISPIWNLCCNVHVSRHKIWVFSKYGRYKELINIKSESCTTVCVNGARNVISWQLKEITLFICILYQTPYLWLEVLEFVGITCSHSVHLIFVCHEV